MGSPPPRSSSFVKPATPCVERSPFRESQNAFSRLILQVQLTAELHKLGLMSVDSLLLAIGRRVRHIPNARSVSRWRATRTDFM